MKSQVVIVKSGTQQFEHSTNWFAAAILCALIAIVIGYCGSCFLTHLGTGVAATIDHKTDSKLAFAKSAINYYVMHGITIAGAGKIHSEIGDSENVSASIKLPLTIWAFIPALALILGGYFSGRTRISTGRWGTVLPAMFGGVLYAAILSAAAKFVKADVNAAFLPEINGTSFNPPNVLFHPSPSVTFLIALVYGVLFAYLGALISIRRITSTETAGKWWACAKSAILMALIVQFLIVGAGEIMLAKNAASSHNSSLVQKATQAIPTLGGIGYTLAYGGSVNASVETKMGMADFGGKPYAIKANLYNGITRNDDQEKSHKSIARAAYILSAILALALFISGWLAVKFGSRDGAIPTSLRILVINFAYLIWLMPLCNITWNSVTKSAGIASELSVFVRPELSVIMIFIFAGSFLFAVAGAYLASVKNGNGLL